MSVGLPFHSQASALSYAINGKFVEIGVQVTEGVELPLATANGGDVLVMTGVLNGEVRESLPCSAQASQSGKAVWSKGSVLSWVVSVDTLATLKNTAPSLRLTLASRPRHAPPGSQGTFLGYVLVPLKLAEMNLTGAYPVWGDWLPLLGPHKTGRLSVTAGMTRWVDREGARGPSSLPTVTLLGQQAQGGNGATTSNFPALLPGQRHIPPPTSLGLAAEAILGVGGGAPPPTSTFYPAVSAAGAAGAASPSLRPPYSPLGRAMAMASVDGFGGTGGGVGMGGPTWGEPELCDAVAAFSALHGGDGGGTATARDGWINPAFTRPIPTSLPSNMDAIPIGYEPGGRKYGLTVKLLGTNGLASLCGSRDGTFWLSYRLFGVLVQGEAFRHTLEGEEWGVGGGGGGQDEGAAAKDTFALRGSLCNLALFLASMPPLPVFVCAAPGLALAVARIPLEKLLDGIPASVRPKRLGAGWTPAIPSDPTVEASFAGVEMCGGFPLKATVGEALGGGGGGPFTLEAVVTLAPIDDEGEGRGEGEGVAPHTASAAQSGGERGSKRRKSGTTAASSSGRRRSRSGKSRRGRGGEGTSTAPSTSGLLYLLPLEVTPLCVHLQEGAGEQGAHLSHANLRLRYATEFTPPGGEAGSPAQLLNQTHCFQSVPLAFSDEGEKELNAGGGLQSPPTPAILHIPHRFLPTNAGLATPGGADGEGEVSSSHGIPDSAFMVPPPGAFVFELLEGPLEDEFEGGVGAATQGSQQPTLVVAQGALTAAVALSASMATSRHSPVSLTLPLFASGAPSISIGHVVVQFVLEEDGEEGREGEGEGGGVVGGETVEGGEGVHVGVGPSTPYVTPLPPYTPFVRSGSRREVQPPTTPAQQQHQQHQQQSPRAPFVPTSTSSAQTNTATASASISTLPTPTASTSTQSIGLSVAAMSTQVGGSGSTSTISTQASLAPVASMSTQVGGAHTASSVSTQAGLVESVPVSTSSSSTQASQWLPEVSSMGVQVQATVKDSSHSGAQTVLGRAGGGQNDSGAQTVAVKVVDPSWVGLEASSQTATVPPPPPPQQHQQGVQVTPPPPSPPLSSSQGISIATTTTTTAAPSMSSGVQAELFSRDSSSSPSVPSRFMSGVQTEGGQSLMAGMQTEAGYTLMAGMQTEPPPPPPVCVSTGTEMPAPNPPPAPTPSMSSSMQTEAQRVPLYSSISSQTRPTSPTPLPTPPSTSTVSSQTLPPPPSPPTIPTQTFSGVTQTSPPPKAFSTTVQTTPPPKAFSGGTQTSPLPKEAAPVSPNTYAAALTSMLSSSRMGGQESTPIPPPLPSLPTLPPDYVSLLTALKASAGIALPPSSTPPSAPPPPTTGPECSDIKYHLGDPSVRRFRLSLHLRTLKDVPYPLTNVSIVTRYSAPLAHISPPSPPTMPTLTTTPPIDLYPGAERLLPGGFFALELTSPTGLLASALCDNPLKVSLWGRSREEEEEEEEEGGDGGDTTPSLRLATGSISLSPVWESPVLYKRPGGDTGGVPGIYTSRAGYESSFKGEDREGFVIPPPILVRICDASVPLSTLQPSNSTHVASLQALVYLEDLGWNEGGEEEEEEEEEGVEDGISSRYPPKLTGSMGLCGKDRVGEEEGGGRGGKESDLSTLTLFPSPSFTHPIVKTTTVPRGRGPMPSSSPYASTTSTPTPNPASGGTSAALLGPLLPLLTHPPIRAQVESLLATLLTRETAALASWRKEREKEWVASKQAVEAQWSKDCEARERARATALEAAWAERESTRQAVVVEAQERVREVEARLRKVLAGAEARLGEAERVKAEAEGERARAKEDSASLQRRVREEGEYAVGAAKRREAEAGVKVAEYQREAEAAKARVGELEGELSKLRGAALASPDACLRDALVSAEGEVSSARGETAKALALAGDERRAREEAQAQVVALAGELMGVKGELDARRKEGEERLRVGWLAREERYVLDGDRATLREIRKMADGVLAAVNTEPVLQAISQHPTNPPAPPTEVVAPVLSQPILSAAALELALKQLEGATIKGGAAAAAGGGGGGGKGGGEDTSPLVKQLKAGRRQLLGSGVGYTCSHPWIQRIDRAILEATGGGKARQMARDVAAAAAAREGV